MAEFIPTGLGGFNAPRPAVRKVVPDKSGTRSYERQELLPPPRPRRNFIPDQETMDTLVDRALLALANGIYWDRGSIINVVL